MKDGFNKTDKGTLWSVAAITTVGLGVVMLVKNFDKKRANQKQTDFIDPGLSWEDYQAMQPRDDYGPRY